MVVRDSTPKKGDGFDDAFMSLVKVKIDRWQTSPLITEDACEMLMRLRPYDSSENRQADAWDAWKRLMRLIGQDAEWQELRLALEEELKSAGHATRPRLSHESYWNDEPPETQPIRAAAIRELGGIVGGILHSCVDAYSRDFPEPKVARSLRHRADRLMKGLRELGDDVLDLNDRYGRMLDAQWACSPAVEQAHQALRTLKHLMEEVPENPREYLVRELWDSLILLGNASIVWRSPSPDTASRDEAAPKALRMHGLIARVSREIFVHAVDGKGTDTIFDALGFGLTLDPHTESDTLRTVTLKPKGDAGGFSVRYRNDGRWWAFGSRKEGADESCEGMGIVSLADLVLNGHIGNEQMLRNAADSRAFLRYVEGRQDAMLFCVEKIPRLRQHPASTIAGFVSQWRDSIVDPPARPSGTRNVDVESIQKDVMRIMTRMRPQEKKAHAPVRQTK